MAIIRAREKARELKRERERERPELGRDGLSVQSGGTRGARKAVVCRGPPHWHTVVRYDSLSTACVLIQRHRRFTFSQVLVQ